MQRERIPITQDGLDKLREEYDDLVNRRRPEVVRAIQQAREEGDLRENAGYDAAKHDQGFIEARIREIEQLLRLVDVIDNGQSSGRDGAVVRLGSTVTVEIDGVEETYTIVGHVEAKPREGRISNESPVGRALLGHRVGQKVTVQTPGATMSARIVSIQA
jgi:transcription elongation factor GreA